MDRFFEKLYRDTENNFHLQIEKKLKEEQKMFIVTANPETFMLGESSPEFSKLLLDEETVIVPDGIGIVKAMQYLKIDVKERIPGVTIAEKLFEYGNTYGKSIFILGSKQEVIDKMLNVFQNDYPHLKVAGAVNGYVDDKDAVFEEMKQVKPDIVLVALGIPKQEQLIYKHLKEFDKGIFVGVGGSLDVLSGTKKRAPKIFIKLNLEWLYRIACEPSRIKRFYNSNVKFLFSIKKYK